MMANGIDAQAYMQSLSGRLEHLDYRALNSALDDMEYLYEVLDPELQYLADELMDRLRQRLKRV